jgi:hypothetical protein
MIYENTLVTITIEPSEIPWVKVFTQRKIKEFSECSALQNWVNPTAPLFVFAPTLALENNCLF